MTFDRPIQSPSRFGRGHLQPRIKRWPRRVGTALAVVCPFALAAAVWFANAWDQAPQRDVRAEAARVALSREAETARQEIAQARQEIAQAQMAHEAAVAAAREAEDRADQQRAKRDIAERTIVELHAGLSKDVAALRSAALDAQARLERERQTSNQALLRLSATQRVLNHERKAREAAERELALLSQAQPPRRNGADPADATADGTWRTHQDARLGFAIEYPARVFLPNPAASTAQRQVFVSRDGKAKFVVHAEVKDEEWSLADLRREKLKETYEDAKLGYAPVRASWFVLSGTSGNDMFYDRVTLTCKGRVAHGWLLVYPVAERKTYDAIVEQMQRTYRYDKTETKCG